MLAGGLSRSQTVLRREGTGSSAQRTHPPRLPPLSPLPLWSPDPEQLPPHSEIHEFASDEAPMSIAPGKTSSDSGQAVGTDRWSQRRLQRLNTEQGFREQRQGGMLSPPLPPEQGQGNSYNGQPSQQAQPPHSTTLQHPPQPHPVQTSAYQGTRTGQIGPPNIGLGLQAQPVSSNSLMRSVAPTMGHADPDLGTVTDTAVHACRASTVLPTARHVPAAAITSPQLQFAAVELRRRRPHDLEQWQHPSIQSPAIGREQPTECA